MATMEPRPAQAQPAQQAASRKETSSELAASLARHTSPQRPGAFLQPRVARHKPAAASRSVSKTRSPKTGPARADSSPVELSSAQASAQGTITVRRSTLNPGREPIVIDRARAVQIGHSNAMFTEYRFEMVRPEVDLAGLLAGNPRVREALGKLTVNPSSWSAGRAMQRALAGGPLWTGGVIRQTARAGTGVRRVPVHGAAGNPVVASGVQGVQAGDHNTMHNRFGYTVDEAKLDPAAALHGNPKLARILATAIAHPGAQAPQRAFTRALQRAHGDAGAAVEQARTRFGGFPVTGDAIQLGTRNTREDVARVIAGQFTVTGWDSAIPYYLERATPALDHALRDPQPFDPAAAGLLGIPRIMPDGTLRLPAGSRGTPPAPHPVVSMKSGTAYVWLVRRDHSNSR